MGKKPMGVIQTRLTTIDMEENKIEIYRSADGKVELNVKLEKNTVWLTQNQMAELFGVDRTSIVHHIRNIYKAEELDEISTCAKNAQVRFEGSRKIVRDIPFYNLDMVISVGYRVNSKNRRNRRNRRNSSEKYRIYLIRPHLQDHQGTEKANNVGKPLPTSGSHLLLTGIYSKIECNEGNIHLYR